MAELGDGELIGAVLCDAHDVYDEQKERPYIHHLDDEDCSSGGQENHDHDDHDQKKCGEVGSQKNTRGAPKRQI